MNRPVKRSVRAVRPLLRAARLAVAGAAAVLLVLVVSATPAAAHDTLTGSSPKEDATVEAPSEIVLTFSGSVRLPRVIVTDASKKEYQAGEPEAVDNKVTAALGSAPPNGEYTVAWRVVSSDGHPIQGTYTFTVEGAPAASPGDGPSAPSSAAAEPPAPEPSATNAAGTGDSGGSSGWLWIGLIALVIAAAAGAVAWFRRSPASGD
ncbi:copper resistance CopC family protein [Actinomadura sp. 7K507]|uniref:copper resistance CopC family protein n=1 Tax=Actinomadura sp. 7K507 TaxID=2530365 RepID=UPI00104EB29E|nr:copper resistance CopC family protein [Actinomadura sp. 7K507]TDC92940.1 copper resistance protein CopC [Actinomadura sp. 7K507]